MTSPQPYAWESREFLRKLLVGQQVSFAVEKSVTSAGNREYGRLWISKGERDRERASEQTLQAECPPIGGEMVSVAELMITEGLVQIREGASRQSE